jgi:hypothetical protein
MDERADDRQFFGITIGDDQSVEEFLVRKESADLAKFFKGEEFTPTYHKPNAGKVAGKLAYGAKAPGPVKILRRETIMKEAQKKVALRALMAAPDEWRKSRHFHNPALHPDIGHLAFGICINKIWYALEPLGLVERRKASYGGGWEIRFTPVNEWKKLIDKDFDAAVEQLYEVVKRQAADVQAAHVARKKGLKPDAPTTINDALLKKFVDEIIPGLFKRIDERVEERIKLTEQGLTNLQDQITQDRENEELDDHHEYVQEQNLNVRVTFGWEK